MPITKACGRAVAAGGGAAAGAAVCGGAVFSGGGAGPIGTAGGARVAGAALGWSEPSPPELCGCTDENMLLLPTLLSPQPASITIALQQTSTSRVRIVVIARHLPLQSVENLRGKRRRHVRRRAHPPPARAGPPIPGSAPPARRRRR